MAVADGTVLRADNSFEEISPEFRKSLLKSASNIKRTPSDVFEHILLGKTVILDQVENGVAVRMAVMYLLAAKL